MARCSRVPGAVDRRGGIVSGLREQQPAGQRRALSRRASHQQFTAHDLRQQLGDGKSEAGAGQCAHRRIAAALKRLEDALQVRLVDANTGVRHFELGDLAAIPDDEAGVAYLGVLDGIGQQVDEDLPQALLVSVYVQRQMRWTLKLEVDAFSGCLQAKHVHELIQEIHQLYLVAVQSQQAIFNSGNVQQPIDEV